MEVEQTNFVVNYLKTRLFYYLVKYVSNGNDYL